MTKETQKTRRVGRPKAGARTDAKAQIIAAAGPIFSRQGFAATRISELAKAAGVTPAMVHYYFDGKEQVLVAVFEAAFAPLLAKLEDPTSLEGWVETFHAHIMGIRWMPHLMLREVIMEGGHLRDHFADNVAPKLVGKWLTLLAQEKQAGRLRPDANDFRHAVLLMGMLLYPFVVAPASGALTGMPFSDEDMIGFRDDAIRLFFKGAKG